jgi:hypothetical protein
VPPSLKEIAREVLDPAGVADDAKAHITSNEQLTESFATRCAWPHLEHGCLLSSPFGLKVSANKCPRAFKTTRWVIFRYNSSSANLLSQIFKTLVALSDRQPQKRQSARANGVGRSGAGINGYSGCSGASNMPCFFMFYSSSINVRVLLTNTPILSYI